MDIVELYNSYITANIVRMFKLTHISWRLYVPRIGEIINTRAHTRTHAHRILVSILERIFSSHMEGLNVDVRMLLK